MAQGMVVLKIVSQEIYGLFGVKLFQKYHSKSPLLELQNLFQYIKFPPVGLGVLRWVEYITTPKYLEKQIEGTPLSLALIDEIAICHPQLHNDVMKLLTKLLENNFPAMDTLILLNLKKNVLGKGFYSGSGQRAQT